MKKWQCSIIIEAKTEEDAYIECIDIDGHDVDWEIIED